MAYVEFDENTGGSGLNSTIDNYLATSPDIKLLDENEFVDFASYPEGFVQAAASLKCLPDINTKMQVLSGLAKTILYL